LGNNSGVFILGLLALWAVSQKPSGAPRFGAGGGIMNYTYSPSFGGYPEGYEEALERTQRTYGAGSKAQIPQIQDQIEEHRLRNPAPKRKIFRPSKTLEPMRTQALAKTQAMYGSGSAAKIPAIQDLIEQRRT